MKLIYFTIHFLVMKHPDKLSISKLWLKKCLHKNPFLFETHNLDNLPGTASFLPAFLHSEIRWSSKLRFLPISILSNFCFAFSRIFSSPILTLTFSYVCPETNSWHLSLLSFMLLVSNYSVIKKRRALISWSLLSQAWNVVSSTKLQIRRIEWIIQIYIKQD